MKRQTAEIEKIFANHLSDNKLISKIYKELYNSRAKKTEKNPQLNKKNGQRT